MDLPGLGRSAIPVRRVSQPASRVRLHTGVNSFMIEIDNLRKNRSMSREQQLTIETRSGLSLAALYNNPADSQSLVLLAHGAGAAIQHPHMCAIATALAGKGIASLRFNFPYMQAGRRRTDNVQICTATFTDAHAFVNGLSGSRPVFIAGHSFGGRMASHYLAENQSSNCRGLICFSFPLHPSSKPGITRASHLSDVSVPMLFLSGSRDSLAEPGLLESVVSKLDLAQLHWLDTADHSFKPLKRTRKSEENVYDESARIASNFSREIVLQNSK